MLPENHLTIRDYWERINGAADRKTGSHPRKGKKFAGQSSFRQILAACWMRRPSKSAPPGLTLAEYLAHPVRVSGSPCGVPAVGGKSKKDPAPQRGHASALPADELSGRSIAAAAARGRRPPSMGRVAVARGDVGRRDRIEKSVRRAAEKYGLPPGLIKSVIRAESNFEVRAVSRAGARGLMQLMPETARQLGVKNAFDIDENIDGGCRYLRQMLDRFDGNVKLALAAYNAGPAAVKEHRADLAYPETKLYVQRVLGFFQRET